MYEEALTCHEGPAVRGSTQAGGSWWTIARSACTALTSLENKEGSVWRHLEARQPETQREIYESRLWQKKFFLEIPREDRESSSLLAPLELVRLGWWMNEKEEEE